MDITKIFSIYLVAQALLFAFERGPQPLNKENEMKLMTLSLLTLLVVAPAAQARELNFPRGPGREAPNRPGRGELVYQAVNQNYQGQNTLALRQILNLGPQFRGRSIEYVILRASTAAGRGQAWVTVNGSDASAAQVIGQRVMEYRFQLGRNADELGSEIEQLQLALQGNFFVEGVGVMLSAGAGGPGQPGRPVEEVIRVGREFQGGHRIAVGTLVNLARYEGMRLVGVSFRAQTRAGQGDATFCASRCSVVENVGRNLAEHSFPVGGEFVDRNAQNWTLSLRGNFYVESIRLQFAR